MSSTGRRSVGYVVSRWGEPTQTFVRREAGAVKRSGVDVVAFSLKRPVACGLSLPVVHPGVVRLAQGMFSACRSAPHAVARVLWAVLRHSNPRNTLHQMGAALVGISWAGRGLSVDHLHSHFGWVSATAAWAASQVSGVPYSVTLHAFEIHTERLNDGFTPVPLRSATGVFCISEFDAEQVALRHGLQVGVVRMGVPESWLEEHEPAPPRRGNLLLSVGSLVEKKGHGDLCRAVGRVRGWVLEIVGEGPLRPQLERLIADLGLGDRVRLLGLRSEDDVRDRLRSAAAFSLACRPANNGDRDGIPVALMEAMALGVPVITTRVGGIPELVAGAGVLVEPGDIAGLAAGIEQMADPARRKEVAAAGRERIASSWTVEQTAAMLVDEMFRLDE